MKQVIDFYTEYSKSHCDEKKAKVIMELLQESLKTISTKQDIIILNEKLDSHIRHLEQKTDILRCDLRSQLSRLIFIMFSLSFLQLMMTFLMLV